MLSVLRAVHKKGFLKEFLMLNDMFPMDISSIATYNEKFMWHLMEITLLLPQQTLIPNRSWLSCLLPLITAHYAPTSWAAPVVIPWIVSFAKAKRPLIQAYYFTLLSIARKHNKTKITKVIDEPLLFVRAALLFSLMCSLAHTDLFPQLKWMHAIRIFMRFETGYLSHSNYHHFRSYNVCIYLIYYANKTE